MIAPSHILASATRRLVVAIAVLSGAVMSGACERSVPTTQTPPAIADSAQASMMPPDANGDSALRFPFVPDPAHTPGAALDVTAADICLPGYSRRVRNVPAAVKRDAYASYGVRSHQPGEYEIDHLISLELGGSNSLKNLWPESFRTHPWNAYVKDALENELRRRVCAGMIDLAKAQQVIAHNWVIGYRIYVHPNPPSANSHRKRRPRHPRPQSPQPQFQTAVP